MLNTFYLQFISLFFLFHAYIFELHKKIFIFILIKTQKTNQISIGMQKKTHAKSFVQFTSPTHKTKKKQFLCFSQYKNLKQTKTIHTNTNTQTTSPSSHVYCLCNLLDFCDGAANVPANASFVIYTDASGQV